MSYILVKVFFGSSYLGFVSGYFSCRNALADNSRTSRIMYHRLCAMLTEANLASDLTDTRAPIDDRLRLSDEHPPSDEPDLVAVEFAEPGEYIFGILPPCKG